ncbi:RNA polymerase sigma factor [Aneurinibacillus aneurinilyticus]|jgi:predicted DNA-binding protein (UPF0251 family)|uniref:RNA polymerase subunit sigma n=1 Tax=Aneurinibacillus aneurinilyticus TaxID=1391 RepID=A0A848D1Q6_ANEAE|nr:sigma factor-like helix-turn-helix DNA-binding protein [Aneurinibacillus aneurinilyticus]NMF00018.1 RNA polymerase subunit sigma [Aneurinibacillus aneurinilyticus]
MGTCAVDIEKGSREYTVKYALNTVGGVRRLLRDIHRLRSARFERGDYAASDILLDLDTAIQRANLTVRQRQAVYYVYEEDMRHEDAAGVVGVDRSAITKLLDRALERIATVYSEWNYGEVIATYTEEIENTNEEGDE